MGMPAAFEPGGFTGMNEAPEARTLALSAVAHKAFVETLGAVLEKPLVVDFIPKK